MFFCRQAKRYYRANRMAPTAAFRLANTCTERRDGRAVVTAVTAKAAKRAINGHKINLAATVSPWRRDASLRMIGAGSSRGRSDEAARQGWWQGSGFAAPK